MIRLVSCCLFLLWSLTSAWSQGVVFKASAGAKQVMNGSTFEITYTLENADGDQFTAPDFSPFKIVSGPSQSYRSTFINGVGTRSISFEYVLQATRPGKHTIPAATIMVQGKTLRTNTVEVEVRRASNDFTTKDKQSQIFIRAEIDTSHIYVGQQVMISYKIYTQVNIESYNILSESNYDGCFTQILDAYKERVVKEVIDGQEFSTKILRKVALFPQQNGRIVIEPLVVRVGVPDPKQKRRSFFSSFNLKTETLNSNEITLLVRSPYQDAPESFSGAVGSFTAHFEVHPLEATTDDAISIIMKLVGNGDIKMVRVPELHLPASFESYDPKVKDEKMINATDSVRGEKIIEYLAIGQEPGSYTISPSFTYFDINQHTYRTIQDSFRIAIQPGEGLKNAQADNQLMQEDQDGLADPILSNQLAKSRSPLLRNPWYWSAFGVPVLGFLFLVYGRHHRRKKDNQSQENYTATAHARLQTAKQHLDSTLAKAFFEELALCLKNYVGSVIDVPPAELDRAALRQELRRRGTDEELIDQLDRVLDQCNYALYAGIHDPSKMTQAYDDAVEIVKSLEEVYS